MLVYYLPKLHFFPILVHRADKINKYSTRHLFWTNFKVSIKFYRLRLLEQKNKIIPSGPLRLLGNKKVLYIL